MSHGDDRDPKLVWNEAGEPRSGRYGDVYFSAQDGLAETRAVFLAGCDLPEAWAGRDTFTVAELGFGTGLNIAALLDLWQSHRPPNGRLHIFSVEGYPLRLEEAQRALSAWPEIAGASDALLSAWPTTTPGFHRIDLPAFNAVLDLAVGEASWALGQWSGQADAWFLDGFSPSTNPDMWSDAVLDALAARSAPDARIATFTVAGAVRRGLSERGFTVEKRPGHGRKRERLEARGQGVAPSPARPRVAIVGAGIAGAAVARALRDQGIHPLIIDAAQPGSGASGFPAALVTPRFDLGDADIAALFAQSLERARDLYTALPGAVISEGVIQLPATDRDAQRFERIPNTVHWGEGQMAMIDPTEASLRLGEPVEGDVVLSMNAAFVAAPRVVVPAWLEGCDVIQATVSALELNQGLWRLTDPSGNVLAEVDAVVLCNGPAISGLLPSLSLNPVRGQADWTETGPVIPAVAWGGYVAPRAEGGFLFGATHDRGDVDTAVRAEDTERNLSTLVKRLPGLAATVERASVQSRAATRATTRDRLPVAGAITDRPGLFVLGGLGSRGFCLAPLLGEHVAALITDTPSPLPATLAQRITSSRTPLAAPSDKADVHPR